MKSHFVPVEFGEFLSFNLRVYTYMYKSKINLEYALKHISFDFLMLANEQLNCYFHR